MQLLYRIQCKQQMNWQRPSKALLFFGNHAIEAVFPKTEVQNCIIHQLRNSSKYVSYKDIKALMADLKAVYAQSMRLLRWMLWIPLRRNGTKNTRRSLRPGGRIGPT